jgi:hypothetical protein
VRQKRWLASHSFASRSPTETTALAVASTSGEVALATISFPYASKNSHQND